MLTKATLLILVSVLLSGCGSVPLESQARSDALKSFDVPSNGMAGVFIYRDSRHGQSQKRSIWINKECVGQTARFIYYYQEVPGDTYHLLETDWQISPTEFITKDLTLFARSGELYFIRQNIEIGTFWNRANLEQVSADVGKRAIMRSNLATTGDCTTEFQSDPELRNTRPIQ